MHDRRKNKATQSEIPLLDPSEDLAAHFLGEGNEDQVEEDFAKLLEDSLSSDEVRRARREKEGTQQRQQPVPVAEQVRQYPSVQDKLDLHGLPAADAAVETRIFVFEAARRGLKTLRIVTGKGLHSERGSVLRDVAEQVLVELKRTGVVLTFVWEKQAKTKSGALLVYLKRREEAAR